MRKKTTDQSLILSGWFDEDLVVPPSGANNYTLSLATTTYALTIENVTKQIALGHAKVGYTLTIEGTTRGIGLNLSTTTYAHAYEATTRGIGLNLSTTTYAHAYESVTLNTALVAAMVPYALTLEAVTFSYVPAGGTAYSLNLATTSYALVIEAAGLTYTPFVVTPSETPAGTNRRFTRYIFKIDGQEFATFDLAQALAALDKAKQLAKKHAQQIARNATKAGKKPVPQIPKITGNAPIAKVALEVQAEITQIYESAYRDAEIAMWIELGHRADDTEDTLLLLL